MSVVLVLFLNMDEIENFLGFLKRNLYRYFKGQSRLRKSIESKDFSVDSYLKDLQEVSQKRNASKAKASFSKKAVKITVPSFVEAGRGYKILNNHPIFNLKVGSEKTELYMVSAN